MKIKKLRSYFLICIMQMVPYVAFAVDSEFRSWNYIGYENNFFNIPDLKYIVSIEARFTQQPHYFERTLSAAGIGYQLYPYLSLWSGYRYDSTNQITGGAPEHILWEQSILHLFDNKQISLSHRLRFEQRKLEGQPQWYNRVRNRVTVVFPGLISKRISPIFYEEIFINVSQPSWINTGTFNQNRAFAGVEITTTHHATFITGYINQYLYTSPRTMNHILYLGITLQ